MRSNPAFVWEATVDIHFGNETVMVFHNLEIDDGLEDGVELVFDAVVHDDMGVALWVVVSRFLYTLYNTDHYAFSLTFM